MTSELGINGLNVSVNGNLILKGINLTVKTGELHIVMGPNGSGKSTLSNTILGSPKFKVESGSIKLDGGEISGLKPDERARLGLFLAFQEPVSISGVNVLSFLRTAYTKLNPSDKNIDDLKVKVSKVISKLGLSEEFLKRSLNEGFSGGEKKRLEIAQLILFRPKIAILDEVDSGLDMDSLRILGDAINSLKKESGVLLVTHYERIFDYIKPDFIHVLMDGKIVGSGGMEVLQNIKEKTYSFYKNEAA